MKDVLHEKAAAVHAVELATISDLDKNFEDNAASLTDSPDLAALYPIVRPLLSWLEAFLYFKPEWQAAFGQLINSLDVEYLPKKKAATKIPGRED